MADYHREKNSFGGTEISFLRIQKTYLPREDEKLLLRALGAQNATDPIPPGMLKQKCLLNKTHEGMKHDQSQSMPKHPDHINIVQKKDSTA